MAVVCVTHQFDLGGGPNHSGPEIPMNQWRLKSNSRRQVLAVRSHHGQQSEGHEFPQEISRPSDKKVVDVVSTP